MNKFIFITLLWVACVLLSSCRQSRPPEEPAPTNSQQAVVTPVQTFTPTVQLAAQQRDSGSVASEVNLGKSSATPTTELVPNPISPTATATATRRPTAIATRQPTVTPSPEYYVTGSANLRSGPGTDYDIVGGRQLNDVLFPIARTADGEWIQIDENIWIWSGLVEGNVEKLPMMLTPVPTATRPPLPTFTPPPAPTQAPETIQQSNVNGPDIICTRYYTTQQDKEDCWWRYHNGLPLIEEQLQIDQNTVKPTPKTFNYICQTDDFAYYAQAVLWIGNLQEILLRDIGYLLNKEPESYPNWDMEMLALIGRFDIVDAESDKLNPPWGFGEAHWYFMQNVLWFSLAGNAFEMAHTWNQWDYWIDTAIDRLEKSDEFKVLADNAIGASCFD